MAEKTKIEWTDSTWNPVKARMPGGKLGFHCEKVSPACTNCYAEAYNKRNLPACGTGLPYVRASRTYVDIVIDESHISDPLHWRRPRRIFVCSMTDLFASFVPDSHIDRVFAAMSLSTEHTFQVLTKRPERMRAYLIDGFTPGRIYVAMQQLAEDAGISDFHFGGLPLEHVWLGTTAEDQGSYDERVPHLIGCPAAVRFLSCEPLLGPIHVLQELDWIIVGGESGPRARPMHPDWARGLRDACVNRTDMGRPWPLPFFFKQWGRWAPAPDEGSGCAVWMTKPGLTLYEDGRPAAMYRVQAGRDGRLLDGQEWSEFPRCPMPNQQ